LSRVVLAVSAARFSIYLAFAVSDPWFDMEWLRLLGSLEYEVSFAEYSLFYRALLKIEARILKEPTNRSHAVCLDAMVCSHQCCVWDSLIWLCQQRAFASAFGVASVSRIDEIIVTFTKEPYKRDYILQKRPII